MTATVQIHEQTSPAGKTVYHWQILDSEGHEFSHSAYHTDRGECEAEASQRLVQVLQEGWIE